jgi:hypothetical protein
MDGFMCTLGTTLSDFVMLHMWMNCIQIGLMPTIYSYSLYHVNLKLKVYHILTLEIFYFLFFKFEKKVKELEFFFQLFHEKLLILSILRGGVKESKPTNLLKISKSYPTLVSLMVVS